MTVSYASVHLLMSCQKRLCKALLRQSRNVRSLRYNFPAVIPVFLLTGSLDLELLMSVLERVSKPMQAPVLLILKNTDHMEPCYVGSLINRVNAAPEQGGDETPAQKWGPCFFINSAYYIRKGSSKDLIDNHSCMTFHKEEEVTSRFE